jgi:hypothetical protein
MQAMTRKDAHRPSEIIPQDYEFVAQEYMKLNSFGDCVVMQQERAKIKAHMAKTGGNYASHQHGGNCMVCGSVNAVYTVIFYHGLSNSYVRMGTDCAVKCDMGNELAFRSFRAGIKDARDNHAGKAKAANLLADHGLGEAWNIFVRFSAVPSLDTPNEENTIVDVVGKLVKYGSISDKQYSFLQMLLERISTRAARMAQREAERAAAKPCPSGKIKITGTVLGTKMQFSDFGDVLKMTVKSDEGWVVYGSVPSCMRYFKDGAQCGPAKDARIEFTATITVSDKDIKFGFFKRPTQAQLL